MLGYPDHLTQSFKNVTSNMCSFAATNEAILWDHRPKDMGCVIFGFGCGEVNESKFELWEEKGDVNSTVMAAVGLDTNLFPCLGKSNHNTGNGEDMVTLLKYSLSWTSLKLLVKDGDEGGCANSLVFQCIRSSDY
ncbi:hypothetical protein V1514DRAFT_321892 [Lipomyces japonicus]|uniref:uncharacterized protein n=1 Tax=Lipomyces japonicus TaxID=56871 RepID=UPI0034CE483B